MPMRPAARAMLSLAWMASAVSASPPESPLRLPVVASVPLPVSQYQDAVALAARNGTPLEIALSIAGAFEGAQQWIVQTHDSAESPTASRVTVVRDGLLDDAVRSERWDITLARTAAGRWELRQITKSWRCWRGNAAAALAAQPCP